MKAYKADFYFFLECQPIDNLIKIHTFLETRQYGYSLDDTSKQPYMYNISNMNIKLKIISRYYKKSLVPNQYERDFLCNFLYSNIRNFLERDVLRDLKMFFSQLFFYAHNDLKKSMTNFETYSKFLYKVYKFCYGNLATDLFEVGAQVLQILLKLSKGKYGSAICFPCIFLIFHNYQK